MSKQDQAMSVNTAPKEVQEFLQLREMRGEIIFLPNIALEKVWVIGEMIEDIRRRQAVVFHLQLDRAPSHQLTSGQCAPVGNLLLRI